MAVVYVSRWHAEVGCGHQMAPRLLHTRAAHHRPLMAIRKHLGRTLGPGRTDDPPRSYLNLSRVALRTHS